MNKVLKDPLEVKSKHNGTFPWSWKAPSYDNRTSSSISAGDDYGIGRKQPVGTEKCSSMESGPIPQHSRSFSPHEIFNTTDKAG